MNKDPFEMAIRSFLNPKLNVRFLRGNDSLRIADTELALHGDAGNNGGPATLRSIELSTGKCIIGHSHQPKIGFFGIQVGTNTSLNLGYNEVGGSSCHNGNASLFKDGHKQLLLGVNYKISSKFSII